MPRLAAVSQTSHFAGIGIGQRERERETGWFREASTIQLTAWPNGFISAKNDPGSIRKYIASCRSQQHKIYDELSLLNPLQISRITVAVQDLPAQKVFVTTSWAR